MYLDNAYICTYILFLALKWAATEKFADYLYGSKLRFVTDNNPLIYVLTTAKLDATGHRWIASLANFDFDICYKPGNMNTDENQGIHLLNMSQWKMLKLCVN